MYAPNRITCATLTPLADTRPLYRALLTVNGKTQLPPSCAGRAVAAVAAAVSYTCKLSLEHNSTKSSLSFSQWSRRTTSGAFQASFPQLYN